MDYERKDREIKKLRFEMEKVSSLSVRELGVGVCVNVREGEGEEYLPYAVCGHVLPRNRTSTARS